MALARVQATPQASTTSTTSIAVTFAAPPTVGNAIVVAVPARGTVPSTSCTDNRGNTYTLAKTQPAPSSTVGVDVWCCAAITATGAPFTVTAAGASINRLAVALEVSGVGSGLVVDQSAGTETLAGGAVTTPATPAVTATEVLLVALVSLFTSGGVTLTVAVVSPTWTQEAETINSPVYGEVDSRVITSALGTTPVGSWTHDGGATYAASAIVAFKAGAAGGGGGGGARVPLMQMLMGARENALDSYNVFDPITTSNTVDLPRGVSGGLWVGGTGDVAAVMASNVVQVFTAVPAGSWLPVAVRRVNATGTTATGLVALYEI